ncbi:MAG: FGGY-family carbohydrate kinase [Acidimicrobiia bacterium]|nr:FGGY-family carbohydrate kinase [Acidimicrobiia bacterium]
MAEVTVGIDIGSSSVKALAVDGDGEVLGRVRVPHRLGVPAPDRMEHDAARAWRRGPRRAFRAFRDLAPRGVCVSAMVPSVTAVDRRGIPRTPGLLYGDARGRTGREDVLGEAGELMGFLTWTAREAPDAHGYWPAQAVANHALAGEAVLDTTTAVTAYPLFDLVGWDAALLSRTGARVEQMPRVAPSGQPAGRVDDAVLEPGTIDALAEQLVAGADRAGDVLVVCGTTLIVWVVRPDEHQVPGYLCVPHTTPGLWLSGGPSNAGGLFLDWSRRFLARARRPVDPARVPVWVPYPRGERVPLHDPRRRGQLVDLDLTHDAAALHRAGFEAAGFVTRRVVEASGVAARRIVAVGGGTRVDEWMQALADCTGLPVDVAAVPEGAARGAAFLARVAAGLESSPTDAARWARTGRTVEPDPAWEQAVADRYGRFLEVAG